MKEDQLYPISEIFTSPQGEGVYCGTAMTFVRLAGCSVGKPLTVAEYHKFSDQFPYFRGSELGAYGEERPLPIQTYTEKCTLYDGRTFLCFVGNTPITFRRGNTPLKYRPIRELQVGDEVISWSKTGWKTSPVSAVIKRQVPDTELLSITFQKDNGQEVFVCCTRNHQFLTTSLEWIRADQLTLSTELHHYNYRYHGRLASTRVLQSQTRSERIKSGKIVCNGPGPEALKKASLRMKILNPMKDPEVVIKGMNSRNHRPTQVEKRIIKLAESVAVPLKYVGNNKLTLKINDRPRNPDFIVPGSKKLVEVFDSSFHYTGSTRDEKWCTEQEKLYSSIGYEVLCLDVYKKSADQLKESLIRYIGNGLKVKKIVAGVAKNGPHLISSGVATRTQNWPQKYLVEVVDITVEGDHNYTGPGGIVSHNCDTDFSVKHRMTTKNIFEQVPKGVRHICITGGEPFIHNLNNLVRVADEKDIKVHVETSGTVPLRKAFPLEDGLPEMGGCSYLLEDVWITVSPKYKALEDVVDRADEIKLLVDKNFDPTKIPDFIADHPTVFIQPVNNEFSIDVDNLRLCMEWQKKYPKWRVSLQLHKVLSHHLKELVR